MGRAKKATFSKVSIHKGKGRARLRFGQRDIWLGKAGSREAENNRLRVHAAWVEAICLPRKPSVRASDHPGA